MRTTVFWCSLAVLTATAFCAEKPSVTKASGGSIRTILSGGIMLDEDSSLNREWIAISDPGLSVTFVGTPGITTRFKDGGSYSSSEYQYSTKFEISVAQPVVAVEIRFITFDVWGERGKVLTMTKIMDLSAGNHPMEGAWRLFSENEASEYYASIAYVARVRNAEGRVFNADVKSVIEEARKFNAKFSEGDLEPDKPAHGGK